MREYPSFTKDQDQFDLLLATMNIGLWEFDVETGTVLRNLRHDNIFGYSELQDRWSAEIFLEHVLEHDRDRVEGLLKKAIATGSAWSFQTRITAADGAKKWISTNGQPKFGEDGKVQKLIGHVIDITETKDSEERQQILTKELNHRIRNTLGVIHSVARLTFGHHDEKSEDFLGRLSAVSDIHDLFQASDWQDVDLGQIVENALKMAAGDRVRVTHPEKPVRLSPNAAITFSLAVHELCVNSLKYGSLRQSEGAVDVEWNISDISEEFVFTWKERNGPPPPQNRTPGFGETILKSALASEIDGEVDMRFAPEGLTVTARGRLTAPQRA